MGVIHQQEGDLEAAKRDYERALAVFETRLGPEHPNTQGVRSFLDALNDELDAAP